MENSKENMHCLLVVFVYCRFKLTVIRFALVWTCRQRSGFIKVSGENQKFIVVIYQYALYGVLQILRL